MRLVCAIDAFVTLHVGTDTFRPVQAERIVDHEMHSEFVSVSDDTAQAIAAAKRDGRRVIAIGTTAVRSLESWAAEVISGQWSVVREGGSERGQVNWPLTTDRGTRWRQWSEPGGRPLGWSGWTRRSPSRWSRRCKARGRPAAGTSPAC